ncbi:MAG: hypothetical protein ACOY2B_01415 [Pseudomonadota bacterium]
MNSSGLNLSHLFCVICLVCAACGTANPGPVSGCAGTNAASLAYDAHSGQVEAALCGGKENDSVRLSGKTPGGLEFSYEAQGATAFSGQQIQAELKQALTKERQETIRELIGIIKTGVPRLSPVPR